VRHEPSFIPKIVPCGYSVNAYCGIVSSRTPQGAQKLTEACDTAVSVMRDRAIINPNKKQTTPCAQDMTQTRACITSSSLASSSVNKFIHNCGNNRIPVTAKLRHIFNTKAYKFGWCYQFVYNYSKCYIYRRQLVVILLTRQHMQLFTLSDTSLDTVFVQAQAVCKHHGYAARIQYSSASCQGNSTRSYEPDISTFWHVAVHRLFSV